MLSSSFVVTSLHSLCHLILKESPTLILSLSPFFTQPRQFLQLVSDLNLGDLRTSALPRIGIPLLTFSEQMKVLIVLRVAYGGAMSPRSLSLEKQTDKYFKKKNWVKNNVLHIDRLETEYFPNTISIFLLISP